MDKIEQMLKSAMNQFHEKKYYNKHLLGRYCYLSINYKTRQELVAKYYEQVRVERTDNDSIMSINGIYLFIDNSLEDYKYKLLFEF